MSCVSLTVTRWGRLVRTGLGLEAEETGGVTTVETGGSSNPDPDTMDVCPIEALIP